MQTAYQNYRQSDVATADRGKLILMVYDHCIKWIRKAEEEMQARNYEKMSKSILRAQKGLNELISTLNMEEGGEIARNLFRLYDFYSRHLSEALRDRSTEALRAVAAMMSRLREAWVGAIENVRRESRGMLADKGAGLSLVT